MTAQSPPLLLTSVKYLVRSVGPLAGVPHVAALVSECLDGRLRWEIPRACRLGNVPLLRCIARRWEVMTPEWAKGEPLYRAWKFSNASVVAARRGDLDVLKWLMTEFDTETKVWKAVDEAARHGHLRILQWLRDECNERMF